MPAGTIMEDNIIPFRPRASRRESRDYPAERSNTTGIEESYAKLLNDNCFELGHKYRFSVIRDGVPKDLRIASAVTKRLLHALEPLAAEFGATALYNLVGILVYFSQEKTEYKIASGGWRTLYLNNSFSEEEIDTLIRPLLQAMSPAQRTANTNIHNLIYGDL